MRDHNSIKLDQLLEAVSFYRGIILDSVEQEFGEASAWPSLRSRLLKALGDRGLANRVREIVTGTSSGSEGGGQ